HLAAAELALVAIDGEVALDLGDQAGVAETHAIADGRPVHLCVRTPAQDVTHDASSTARRRRAGTSRTVFCSPGSKRTAAPAGMSRCMPRASSRLNASARLVSKK